VVTTDYYAKRISPHFKVVVTITQMEFKDL